MLSGLAHLVTKKAIYVVGVAIIAVAKPACEYTVKLILRDTSLVIKDTIVPIMEENQYVIRELINEVMKTNKSMSLEIKEFVSNEIKESLVLAVQSGSDKNGLDEDILIKIKELINVNVNRMNESLETNIKKIITMLNTINVDDMETKENIVVSLNNITDKLHDNSLQNVVADLRDYINGKLPDKDHIETIAKKYAMYLHDEHMELMNIKAPKSVVAEDKLVMLSQPGRSLTFPQEQPAPKMSHLKIPTPRSNKDNLLSIETTAASNSNSAPKLTMRKPLSARN